MIKCRSTEQEKPGVMNTCGTSLTTSATDVGRLSCTIAAATCAVTASANVCHHRFGHLYHHRFGQPVR